MAGFGLFCPPQPLFQNRTLEVTSFQMSKGRKPKPPSLRLLEGTRPFNRTKPEEMAVLNSGTPDAPAHLVGLALDHWNLWADHLGKAGMLERIDTGALEAACVAYARAVQADKEINETGLTQIDAESGAIRRNPLTSISRESWETYRHFALEFGGTPCSRAKLKLPTPNKQVDEFESFIKEA